MVLTDKQKTWKNAQHFKTAVYRWSDRINVEVKEIQLRQMKNKWASISTTGRLTLNKELMDLPQELGEFVIVHELIHLLVPNHSKLFKCYMSAYLPDWQDREKRLKKLSSQK
ncbi:M48 metallopeptidase family protein [Geminocystis herdmanii]|uniref:M48 metallopeptidase family protein n=1 Tax=Geminocystis herdmanii TaxID=669359 RepID=UPI00034789D9|nr:M48 family metallopeptidase [Geminocystis herdmanii]